METAPVLDEIKKRLDKEEIEKYRTEGTYTEFKMIVQICLKSMVSAKHWKMNRGKLELSGLLTVADEALALLVLENNYKEWVEKAKGNDIDKKNRLTKYTNQGLRHNGTRKGWSMSGLKRFNTIFKEIKLERQRERSKANEVQILDEWKTNDYGNRTNNNVGDGGMTEDEAAEQEVFVSETDFNYE